MTHKPIALVTGGAQGIGYACGEALADEGYLVILSDVKDFNRILRSLVEVALFIRHLNLRAFSDFMRDFHGVFKKK